MKFRLAPNAELELLTKAELEEVLLGALEQIRAEQDTPIDATESGKTDAGGALTLRVYTVPLGYVLTLNRLAIDADGYTPAAPYTNAAGYIDVIRGTERVDFVRLSSGIPALSVDSGETANRFRNGQAVDVSIVGGPASTNVRVVIAGVLRKPSAGAAARIRR